MWDSKCIDWAYFWEWIGLMCKHAWGWLPHVPFTWCFHAHNNAYRDWQDSVLVGEWIVCSPLFSSLLYEIWELSLKFSVPASFHLFLYIYPPILGTRAFSCFSEELFFASSPFLDRTSINVQFSCSSIKVLISLTCLNMFSFFWMVYEALGMFKVIWKTEREVFCCRKKPCTCQ